MVLAANVLNAIGGTPSIDRPGFVPRYPCTLPHSDGRLVVHLRRFSPEAVDTFLRIERPEPPRTPTAGRPVPHDRPVLRRHRRSACSSSPPSEDIFTGDPARQISGTGHVYGMAGEPIAVVDLDSALAGAGHHRRPGRGHRSHDPRRRHATGRWPDARSLLPLRRDCRWVAASGHRTRRVPGRPGRPCRSTSRPSGRCAPTRRSTTCRLAATYGR